MVIILTCLLEYSSIHFRIIKTDKLRLFLKSTPRIIDKIFVGMFFVLLFIPMSNISNKDISRTENRVLAKYPHFFIKSHFNDNFTSEFDSWFNDRFNGRKKLIRFNTKFKNLFDDGSPNEKVFYGHDGWLFYKDDNSLDNFQNKTFFSDEELKIISKYLSDIDKWARKRGKSFYYLIAPDKNKIYGEHIRSLRKIHPDTESRTQKLIKYLKENTTVKVVYPYQQLLDNKGNGLLYYKQDTHWNDFGSYIAYKELMNVIKKDYIDVEIINPVEYEKVLHETGDLSQMIDFSISKDQSVYLRPKIVDEAVCEYFDKEKDPKKGITCKNTSKPLKMIVFRDSFSNALTRYFSNTFSFVKYKWRYTLNENDLEYINKNNVDIIILETVERFIPSLISLKFPEN